MDKLLAESFAKLLAGCCSPAVVRQIEAGGDAGALWLELESSGFADALVDEAAGGAALTLADAFALFTACGQAALPLPLGHTLMVRAALARAGLAAPEGSMTIAPAGSGASGPGIDCRSVPFGALADWVLVAQPHETWLLPVASRERRSSGVHGSLQAHLHWPERPAHALHIELDWPWQAIGAVVTAAMMAGALQHVLAATVNYANERAQFGKPIGKFQAVQQQLSVLAEQAFAASIAAEIGCRGDGVVPLAARAAVAKARCGEAAEKAVAIAHAVHGAIGATAEFDLQLYTRRLQEWRNDFGAAPHWHAQLGQALLERSEPSIVQYLLAELAP